MPDWTKKVAVSVVTTIALAALFWSWSLNSRLALMERDLEQLDSTIGLVQSHDAAIRVIESRLGYIEAGINEIKVLIRERQ